MRVRPRSAPATASSNEKRNVLFDAGEAVLATGVVDDAELAAFRESWAELKEIDEDRRHAVLSTSTQGAYERALALERDERRELRDALERFVRFYGFLAQVLSYVPAETEVLFQFSKVLLKRLLAIAPSGGVNLAGSVALTHFRLDELGADRIELKEEEAKPVSAITGDGRGGAGPGQIPLGPLGELVEVFNERYGEALGSADALRVVEEVRDVVEADNAALQAQARANSREDFVRHRDDLLIGAALTVSGERDKQATLLKAMLDDEDFRERAGDLIMGSIWDEHRGEPAG
jgi:type I restriction enzyme R subunit